MAVEVPGVHVAPVDVRDRRVLALVQALTAELAGGGYSADETFGYSPQQLERAGVHLVGARVTGRLVGVGGLELQGGGAGELKRFYVTPEHRGTGVADALLGALVDYAAEHRLDIVRLETGNRQPATGRGRLLPAPRLPRGRAVRPVRAQRDLGVHAARGVARLTGPWRPRSTSPP